MQEIAVPILSFFSVIAIGGAFVVAGAERRSRLRSRLLGLEEGSGEPEKAKDRGRPIDVVASVGHALSRGKASRTLRQDLAQAGYHDANAATVYIGAKVILGVLCLASAALLVLSLRLPAPLKVLGVLAAATLGTFAPNAAVRMRRERRSSEIRRHLADAVDLLEICVSSGMGLDMAWNAVTDEVRRVSTILADEMALTNLEIHLGAPRAAAMRHMAERTGAEELTSLVATLVQSERFGTSIADALRVFATSLREHRTQKAEEAAEKMAVKLLFPMVLAIFPAMLIVVAGPAALELFKTLSGSGR
ncbi:MAG: type II secretion system F family protein [Planctomycetes bacterium]|nr:type II secretion system F family protein [Planctomycetota bacterium]